MATVRPNPAAQVEPGEQVTAHPVAHRDHGVHRQHLPRVPRPEALGLARLRGSRAACAGPGCPEAAEPCAGSRRRQSVGQCDHRRAAQPAPPARTGAGADGSSASPGSGAPPSAAGSRPSPPSATPASASGADAERSAEAPKSRRRRGVRKAEKSLRRRIVPPDSGSRRQFSRRRSIPRHAPPRRPARAVSGRPTGPTGAEPLHPSLRTSPSTGLPASSGRRTGNPRR